MKHFFVESLHMETNFSTTPPRPPPPPRGGGGGGGRAGFRAEVRAAAAPTIDHMSSMEALRRSSARTSSGAGTQPSSRSLKWTTTASDPAVRRKSSWESSSTTSKAAVGPPGRRLGLQGIREIEGGCLGRKGQGPVVHLAQPDPRVPRPPPHELRQLGTLLLPVLPRS